MLDQCLQNINKVHSFLESLYEFKRSLKHLKHFLILLILSYFVGITIALVIVLCWRPMEFADAIIWLKNLEKVTEQYSTGENSSYSTPEASSLKINDCRDQLEESQRLLTSDGCDYQSQKGPLTARNTPSKPLYEYAQPSESIGSTNPGKLP